MKKLIFIRFSVSVMTVLFLSATIIYFISSSKKEFFIHSNYNLKTITKEKANIIQSEINHAEDSVKLLSHFVSSQMNERELKNPNEIFSKFTRQLPFDYIEYIRWDGLNMMNSMAGFILSVKQPQYHKRTSNCTANFTFAHAGSKTAPKFNGLFFRNSTFLSNGRPAPTVSNATFAKNNLLLFLCVSFCYP